MPQEGKQPSQVPVDDIENTALDFLALLLVVRGTLKMTGDYTARLTVHPATQIFRRPDPGMPGHYVPWDEQRVYGYRPVDGPIIGTADRDEVLSSWVDIVTDAVNQAGAACALDARQLATTLWVEE